MKQIIPMDPNVLCKKVDLQNKIGEIIIPGQEEKKSAVRKIIAVSPMAEKRGIQVGDIIVTRQAVYAELPECLTEQDELPYDTDEKVEIIDVSQIIALYRESQVEETENN